MGFDQDRAGSRAREAGLLHRLQMAQPDVAHAATTESGRQELNRGKLPVSATVDLLKLLKIGSGGRDRTYDQLINRLMTHYIKQLVLRPVESLSNGRVLETCA